MSSKSKKTRKKPELSSEKAKTTIKRIEKKFLETEKRFQQLLEHLPVGVYRTTPDGKIIEANQTLAKILGYERHEDLEDINVKDLYVRQEDRDEHLEKLNAKGTFFAEFKLRRKDGQTIWGRDYPSAVLGSGGGIKYYDGILVDITEQKAAEEKLKKVLKELEISNNDRKKMIEELRTLSLKDDLTGLFNRRGFFTIAAEFLKMSDRRKTRMFLLFLDVDNLKKINDSLGHHLGDRALVEIARILKKTFRRSDVIGRMGGDEFAVFPLEASGESIQKIEHSLRKNILRFNEKQDNLFELSVSIGVSFYDPFHPSSIDDLLMRADKVMYEEKRRKAKLIQGVH
jgi:diguanylate cyclase (GGDEF)-like protein/PAS domain S-box-containing protein